MGRRSKSWLRSVALNHSAQTGPNHPSSNRCIYIYLYLCACMYIYMFYAYTYIYIYIYTYSCLYPYISMLILYIYICIYIYIQYRHAFNIFIKPAILLFIFLQLEVLHSLGVSLGHACCHHACRHCHNGQHARPQRGFLHWAALTDSANLA